jgi:hypothetical protein
VKFRATDRNFTAGVRSLAARVRGGVTIALDAGAAMAKSHLLGHLKRLQARGNAKGWPSRKFFSGGADSVSKRVGLTESTATTRTVSISDPRFVHRIMGGPVKAKRGKFLTIPLTAKAYRMGGKGSLRQSWPGLLFIKAKQGTKLLAEKKGEKLTFQFVLKQAVTHRPHPDELPDEQAMQREVGQAMLAALKRRLGAR